MERLKLQLGQIDVYKEQIQNLKKQVQVSEGKIKFYDAENARRQSHLEEQLNMSNSKEATLLKEVERKDLLVQSLQKQLEEQLKASNDWAQAVDLKQKENSKLDDELALLNKRVQDMMGEQELKEVSRMEQESSLQKQVKTILF